MGMMIDSERGAYYRAAQTWAQQRDAQQVRSARLAWTVAAIATGVAGLEAVAIMAMAPLKTVVPYTLLVDSHTGFTQTLEGTHPQTIRPDAALTQSLLAQYVVAREGYDIATVEEQYRKVALWSAEGARRDYLALMQPDNAQGPFHLYGRTRTLHVAVESVTPIGPGRAMVRHYADRPDGAGREYWVATVQYRFSGAPQRIEDRLVNPLGFQVIAYRRDQEAPPAFPPAPAVAATPAGAALRDMPMAAAEAVPTAPRPVFTPTPSQDTAPATPQTYILRQRPFGPHRLHPQIIQPGGGEP